MISAVGILPLRQADGECTRCGRFCGIGRAGVYHQVQVGVVIVVRFIVAEALVPGVNVRPVAVPPVMFRMMVSSPSISWSSVTV